jgi:adenylate kinase family enzyme
VKRVAVVGCGGSGKSRLARALGRELSLPVIHIDAEYWCPGWTATPQDEWELRHAELIAGERWVMDGNFHATMPQRVGRADTVVFLDLPRRSCLRGALTRLARQWGQVRDDMGPDCPEGLDLPFLRFIWRFRRDVRPEMLVILQGFESDGGRVITLRSRREVDRFLSGYQAPPS